MVQKIKSTFRFIRNEFNGASEIAYIARRSREEKKRLEQVASERMAKSSYGIIEQEQHRSPTTISKAPTLVVGRN